MKSMREINLETYSLSLLTAKEDILNPRSSTNWALFAYDGIMNRLKLSDSGVGGLNELMTKLHPRRSLYGMCRVGTNQSHIVMILWVGNEVDEYRKAECASHLPAIRSFFREVQIFLPAHTLDEITEERICTLACKAATVMQAPRQRHVPRREDRQEAVGTNYRRTIASAEILRIQRDSFWAQAEREEDERKKEEQRRAAEDRRKREKERLLHERRQAEERERKMMEREQRIKEQRRIQAQMEAEQHRQDRLKWEDQVREREEEERRARYSNSESKEKATEAAALVSQRTSNPRDFFRQLSSSNSQPSSPFPVRSPHRGLHGSPTDNVFIFNELSPSTPPSPYRSTVASPYRPLTPTSKSPTLVFPNSATSLWHNPATVSSSHLEQNPTQNSAMLSSRSQIHPSSPQLTESTYKDTVDHTPPSSSLQLQTQPPTVTNTLKSEINTPIMAILDSLVFYPPPPTTDLDYEGSYEAKTTAELPSPPSGFEPSPKHSKVLPEASMQTQSDFDLDSQSISDSSVCTPGARLSSPPQCSPVLLVSSSLPVLQPPSRPLPDLPVTPQTVKDLNLKRDFTALSSVISTVEEEELEEEDGERNQKECIQEQHETKIKDEEDKVVEERDGVIGYEEEGGKERVDMREESEEINAGQEKPDGKMMEIYDSEKEHNKKIVEEIKRENIQDEKNFEKEKIQHGEIMEECEKEQMMEEDKDEKYQDEKIVEESESEKYQDQKIVEECKRDNLEDDTIVDKSESEKYQDDKILEESQSEKLQDVKIVEESKSEKYQDGKIVEEYKREKFEDDKIVDKSDSEKYQDDNIFEESQSEKLQDVKIVEECKREKLQDVKIVEECKREKLQVYKMIEKSESENHQDDKILERSQSEKLQDEKIVEECKREKLQDYKIVDKSESEKYQDDKIIEESQSKKLQDEKSVEECKKVKFVDDKIIEESKSEKYQDEKIVKESECEKYQDDTILEESESEKLQDGKIVEEDNTGKEQDEEMIETCASNEDQKDKEYYQDEYEQSLMNQESGEKSNVDFNRAMNLNVLKVESDTEIIMNYDATDEQGVEKLNSVKLNKNEERNTTFMIKDEALETEYHPTVDKQNDHESCSETHFSQQTPIFPESSTTGIGQYSQRSLPESIPNNENEPRMSTDLQTLSSWNDSQTLTNDTSTAISFSQTCLQNHPGSEQNHITLSEPAPEQSCTTENITSAIPQSQASTGQSDGEEELQTVNHFIKADLDSNRCVSDPSQQDLTNENTSDDEEEEAATDTASDGGQDSKCDSAPKYPNEAQLCEISLNSRDIGKLQKTDEPLTSQRGSEELSWKIGDISTLMSSEIDVAMETDHHS